MPSKMVVNMDEAKFREILREEIHTALKNVGLSDENAQDDIKGLRGLLKAYRLAQSTMLKTFFISLTIGLMGLLTFGMINKINGGE